MIAAYRHPRLARLSPRPHGECGHQHVSINHAISRATTTNPPATTPRRRSGQRQIKAIAVSTRIHRKTAHEQKKQQCQQNEPRRAD